MPDAQPFKALDLIIESLDARPEKLLSRSKPVPLSKDAVCIADIPKELWGLHNLVMAQHEALEARQKAASESKKVLKRDAAVRAYEAYVNVWALVIRDEIPETQKYMRAYTKDGKVYGSDYLGPVLTARIGVVGALRSIWGAKKGSEIPRGIDPPFGYPMIGEAPPWIIALQAITMQISADIMVRSEFSQTLQQLAHAGLADYLALLKAKNSGIQLANDGNMYEVPAELASPVREMVRQVQDLFDDGTEVTAEPNPKRLM